eukprot:IDg8851t1
MEIRRKYSSPLSIRSTLSLRAVCASAFLEVFEVLEGLRLISHLVLNGRNVLIIHEVNKVLRISREFDSKKSNDIKVFEVEDFADPGITSMEILPFPVSLEVDLSPILTPTDSISGYEENRKLSYVMRVQPSASIDHDLEQLNDEYLNPSSACSDKGSQLSTGTSACSERSQGTIVALWCSNWPILAFILRAGRALSTAYATSNTIAFPFIAQRSTFRPCRPAR